MILKKFEDLPEYMQNNEVKKYYDLLQKKKVSLILKRIFDIIFSIILLIILLPILIIISICIKCDSKGPVFYRQERVTTYGKIFKIFKFRTMIQNADKKGTLVTQKNDSRITRVGSIIRKMRLDELPQLINILIGDMSFVGTRPEVKKYVDKYTENMYATLLMPAGVTSIASIEFKDEDEVIDTLIKNGKTVDEIYIENILPEKMKYNLEYITKFSIKNDLIIVFKTVIKVFVRV